MKPSAPTLRLLLCLQLALISACTSMPAADRSDEPGHLIPTQAIADLNNGTSTRKDCTTRLGSPSYVGSDGQFLAFERSVPYRNLSRASAGTGASQPAAAAAAASAQPQDVIYFQIVGVWLDPSGKVVRAREFVSPCSSCREGEMMFNDSDIYKWMRSAKNN